MRSPERVNNESLPVADDMWWTGLTSSEQIDFEPTRYFQEAQQACYVEAGLQVYEENERQAAEMIRRPKHNRERSFARGVIAAMRSLGSVPRHRIVEDV